MYIDRDEMIILSRGGRVPRATRPVLLPVRVWSQRAGPSRVATLVEGLRRRSHRGDRLDVHSYLKLEFAVDDERPGHPPQSDRRCR